MPSVLGLVWIKAQTQTVRIMQPYICKGLQNKGLALIIQSASPRKAKRVRTGKTYSDSRFALQHFLPTATNNATKIAFQTKTQLVVHHVSHFLGVSNKGMIAYRIFSVYQENTKTIHLIMMIWLVNFIISNYKLASSPPKDPGGIKKIFSNQKDIDS